MIDQFKNYDYFDLRKKNDGCVYFGFQSELNHVVVNDFLIPTNDSKEKMMMRGRHFVVFYQKEEKGYFVRDLGIGYGVF